MKTLEELLFDYTRGDKTLEETNQALKELGWSRANLRDWTGTAAENLDRLKRESEELSREEEQLKGRLAGMGDCWPRLWRLADTV